MLAVLTGYQQIAFAALAAGRRAVDCLDAETPMKAEFVSAFLGLDVAQHPGPSLLAFAVFGRITRNRRVENVLNVSQIYETPVILVALPTDTVGLTREGTFLKRFRNWHYIRQATTISVVTF